MNKLKQIFVRKKLGDNHSDIARFLKLSRTTVIRYINTALGRGLNADQILEMADSEIAALLYSPQELDSNERLRDLMDRMPHIHRELKRTGVTRQLLWIEYKQSNPSGFNYSRFCHYVGIWGEQQKAHMHFEHELADKLFVDFTGKKLRITDSLTGKEKKVETFVALLGHSQYTYVEVVPDQSKESFLSALNHALSFFGGVPKAIVCDNLKAGVKKASKYEAELNDTFDAFGNHYQTSILATRPYKPRDKSLVENAVGHIYKRVYAPMRDRKFASIDALNRAVRPLLDQHNRTPFQRHEESRFDRWNQERKHLNPLPQSGFEIKYTIELKVQKNCHVLLGKDKHYYSVPYRYISNKVKVMYSQRQVEIFHGLTRIAVHRRDNKRYAYTTVKEHLPSSHQFIADWSPDKFTRWAQGVGKPTEQLIREVLSSKAYPEQAYKSCVGILSLAKTKGKDRLNAAAERALSWGSPTYKTIKRILDNGFDKIPDQPTIENHIPGHENVRGKDYYS